MQYFGKESVNEINTKRKLLTCLIILAYMCAAIACANTNENNTSNTLNETESSSHILDNNGAVGNIADDLNDSFPPNYNTNE